VSFVVDVKSVINRVILEFGDVAGDIDYGHPG
jgi:hypothetical protein